MALERVHLKPNGKEPITDYEEAAKIGYFIEYGGESRTTRQHEKGLVKFQTPTMRIEAKMKYHGTSSVTCGMTRESRIIPEDFTIPNRCIE